MEKIKLDFGVTLKDSIAIGTKNALSILGCVVLWILTVWIPYINVGTTIAIMTLPIELSKGKVVSPTAIFDAKYRKYFGEVFMVMGLMYIPVLLAFTFMVIPGIVLSLSWSLAIYFVLDKGKNPTAAISLSNEATYGNKWAMFGVQIVLAIACGIAMAILSFIPVVGPIIGAVLCMAVMISANASIYRQLGHPAE